MRLYEINQQIRDILSQVNDDGELPDGAFDELAGLNEQAEIKYEAIACLIKEHRQTARALKEEEYILRERRRRHENKVDSLEAYLSDNMLASGLERLETPKTVISYRKSIGLVVDDESKVPGNYFKVIREVSKSTIIDDIKSGIEVPGAHMETRNNIQIK